MLASIADGMIWFSQARPGPFLQSNLIQILPSGQYSED